MITSSTIPSTIGTNPEYSSAAYARRWHDEQQHQVGRGGYVSAATVQFVRETLERWDAKTGRGGRGVGAHEALEAVLRDVGER